jgi:hypothetical protein
MVLCSASCCCGKGGALLKKFQEFGIPRIPGIWNSREFQEFGIQEFGIQEFGIPAAAEIWNPGEFELTGYNAIELYGVLRKFGMF